ncbi:MAG: CapA family protein [Streptosporangiaceae bacterium]
MTVTIALAGDTMLGRSVAERLAAEEAPDALFSPGLRAVAAEADLFVLNLECCLSERGEPWPDPDKPFFFRAQPVAAEALASLGVDCVTLANNHALDFGVDALLDTPAHLSRVGIATVGAGAGEEDARRPATLEAAGVRVGVVGVTDHPRAYAAGRSRPGVAYADVASGVPRWLRDLVGGLSEEVDVVLVTPHWGPNMIAEPLPYVRSAARALTDAGADVVAGHSAHVFHGVAGRVVYDLGDFIDDYAVHPLLRNDLGLLFLVTVDRQGPVRLEAVPIALDFCHTRLAEGDERAWIQDRFVTACAAFGTHVDARDGRLVVNWP